MSILCRRFSAFRPLSIYVHMYRVYISTDQGVDQLSSRITAHSHGREELLSGPHNFTSRGCSFPCPTRISDASLGWQKSLEIHPCWTPGRSAMPWCNQWQGTKNRGESWWRHQMELFSALLALCEKNTKQSKQSTCPLCGEYTTGLPSPMTSSFVVVSLNKLLNKQSIIRWSETQWRSCDVTLTYV